MRSLPVIFLAVLTAAVIGVSAFLTASHFGMRDWPNPPMPDTATRLITPTEAAGRTSDRGGDDGVDLEVIVDSGAGENRRAGRRTRNARTSTRRAARRERSRARGSGSTSGERRSGNRRDDDRRSTSDADDAAAEITAPTTGSTTPSPEASTSAPEASQARTDEPATPVTEPPITLEPIVRDLPVDDHNLLDHLP
jgi:hypothetical protein